MAVAKQQQLAKQDTTTKIFDWAKTQLDKTEDLYKKRKSEIIKTVAERLRVFLY